MKQTTRAAVAVAWLALAGVSVLAGVASYLHGVAVVSSVGEGEPLDYLIPFLADLVILGASASLLAAARDGGRLPRLTIAALAVAIGVTLAVNVAAGWHHGWGGRLVAGWPAVAFILALHSLAGVVRRGRAGAPSPAGAATPGHGEPPGMLAALAALVASDSRRKLAAELGVPKSRVDSWAARISPPAGAALAAEAPAGPPPAATPPGPPVMASANGQVRSG